VNSFLRTAVAGLTLAGLLLMSALPVMAADDARIRVLHASPDAPAVDIWINDAVVDGLTNLPFGALSDYLSVPADTYNVKVFATGTDTNPVIDADATVEAGMGYTIAAIGDVANIQPKILVDDPALTAGESFVRVIHFSPDAPGVDVAPDGADPADAVVSNLEFPDATGYLALPPGSYDLEVRLAGTTMVALQLPPLDLATGTAYSVFAIGSAADEPLGGNELQALVAVDDTFMPDTSTIEQPAPSAALGLIVAGLLGLATFTLIAARSRFAVQPR
jgi:hypothetical protein